MSDVPAGPSQPTTTTEPTATEEWTLDGSDVSLTEMGMAVEAPGDQSQSPSRTEVSAVATDAPAAASTSTNRKTGTGRGRGDRSLYFDIETIPDKDRMHLFNLPEIEGAKPRAELAACPAPDELLAKPIADIKKIVADVCPPDEWWVALRAAEDGRQKRKGIFDLIDEWLGESERLVALDDDRRKLLSTTPLYCSICAFAYATGDEDPHSIVVGLDGATEADILDAFWLLVTNCKPLCGFNVIGFDLPVLFTRSMILGVPPTRLIDMKPWGGDVLDIYLALFGGRGNTSKDRPGKMKDVARLLGVPVPAGDVDGSKVQELYESDPEQVGVYCESDVEVVRGIRRKMTGLFC